VFTPGDYPCSDRITFEDIESLALWTRGHLNLIQDVLRLIDLSHIYFAGEDPPEDLRLGCRSETTQEFRGRRKHSAQGPQKRGSLRAESTTLLSPLVRFILRQSGLDSGAYQPKALNRRLGACLRVLRTASEEAALKALRQNPALLEACLGSLLIGVSDFFRDAAVFDQIKRVVLPQMLQNDRTVRVYSAGCSAGHELYSVAMILDELGGLEASQLLGLDCRPDAIEQARSGGFSVSDLKGIGEHRQQRYFRVEGRCAVILPRLRRNATWHVGDFGVFLDPKPWDLILFRNVAIYLQAEYANRIWHRLDQQLKPGGMVIAGSADRPPEDLRWKRESSCIYRKPLTVAE